MPNDPNTPSEKELFRRLERATEQDLPDPPSFDEEAERSSSRQAESPLAGAVEGQASGGLPSFSVTTNDDPVAEEMVPLLQQVVAELRALPREIREELVEEG